MDIFDKQYIESMRNILVCMERVNSIASRMQRAVSSEASTQLQLHTAMFLANELKDLQEKLGLMGVDGMIAQQVRQLYRALVKAIGNAKAEDCPVDCAKALSAVKLKRIV